MLFWMNSVRICEIYCPWEKYRTTLTKKKNDWIDRNYVRFLGLNEQNNLLTYISNVSFAFGRNNSPVPKRTKLRFEISNEYGVSVITARNNFQMINFMDNVFANTLPILFHSKYIFDRWSRCIIWRMPDTHKTPSKRILGSEIAS